MTEEEAKDRITKDFHKIVKMRTRAERAEDTLARVKMLVPELVYTIWPERRPDKEPEDK
jgi:hypothetical protein